MPWQLPEVLPPTRDLREGVEILQAELTAVERKHAAFCLAKLSVAFEAGTKLSGDEARMRVEVWLETCGDLPNDLWSKATLAAMQTLKWMPKPSEFRALVEREMTERQKKLARAKAMLAKVGEPVASTEFQRDPEAVRLRTMRDSLKRIGKLQRAAPHERELAKLEGREPEEWARIGATPEVAQAPVERPVSAAMAAQQAATRDRLAELAKAHRTGVKPPPRKEIETLGDMLDELPPADERVVEDYGRLATG